MPSVRFLPLARDDLHEIWEYIAQDNIEAAERLVNRIEELGQLLAQHLHLGRQREEVAAGLRSFPMDRYLVFYRPIEDGIEIVRVLHASRDIDNIF
jgi:toxin ParE1/3/4